MKIVVIGGSGLIGSRLVSILRSKGHEVLAASPDSGVDTITGAGLDAALAGTQVVVDVSNSPSFDDAAVLKFFETSGAHLLAAEARAGVGHHVALSIVGTDRVRDSGYLHRAARRGQQQRSRLGRTLPTHATSVPSSLTKVSLPARARALARSASTSG